MLRWIATTFWRQDRRLSGSGGLYGSKIAAPSGLFLSPVQTLNSHRQDANGQIRRRTREKEGHALENSNHCLRHRWREGTSYVIFDPMDLLGKLAARVPPRRFNLVRYHGILDPSARWRSRIVPVDSQDGVALRTCPNCSGSEGEKVGQGKRHGNAGKGTGYRKTNILKAACEGISCKVIGDCNQAGKVKDAEKSGYIAANMIV